MMNLHNVEDQEYLLAAGILDDPLHEVGRMSAFIAPRRLSRAPRGWSPATSPTTLHDGSIRESQASCPPTLGTARVHHPSAVGLVAQVNLRPFGLGAGQPPGGVCRPRLDRHRTLFIGWRDRFLRHKALRFLTAHEQATLRPNWLRPERASSVSRRSSRNPSPWDAVRSPSHRLKGFRGCRRREGVRGRWRRCPPAACGMHRSGSARSPDEGDPERPRRQVPV